MPAVVEMDYGSERLILSGYSPKHSSPGSFCSVFRVGVRSLHALHRAGRFGRVLSAGVTKHGRVFSVAV